MHCLNPLFHTLILSGLVGGSQALSVDGNSKNTTLFVAGNGTDLVDNGKLTIQSEGIRASFITYGARITNLFVVDSSGAERDIVMGYDSPAQYASALPNETFGGVHGRYIYSLSNASLPLDPSQDLSWTFSNSSASLQNSTEQDASDWIARNWTTVAHTSTSVTFQLIDFDLVTQDQTVTLVTYTLKPHQLSIRIVALSTTSVVPLMPFSRIFWNLDGGAVDGDVASVLNHSLLLPYSGQRIDIDAASRLPTSLVDENSLYSAYDFWHASKTLGHNFTSSLRRAPAYCADLQSNCTGYDTSFLVDRSAMEGRFDWTRDPAARVQSSASGLRMYLFTDQAALHVATCNHFDGSVALKASQGGGQLRQYGCVALAPHDWPAGLAHPGWMRQSKQASGPADAPYVLQAVYSFATIASTRTTCLSRSGPTATVTITATATVTTTGEASLFG